MVTLVTDVPGSRRAAYVGIDNRAAGATAAQWTHASFVQALDSFWRDAMGVTPGR